MPKYHAYLRVSTSRQAQKTGFARQLQSIERFCQREGIPLDHIWQERGISGCLLKRPTLGELLESAQPRDCVYIEDLTRLARKLAVQLQIVTLLIQKGGGLVAWPSPRPNRNDLAQATAGLAQAACPWPERFRPVPV